ncbi:hypothetical protein IU450_37735 [Nocardia abscessus]|uniref:hypothetical protein n=1 Tax=Nocardia abscessus TaxID=120957 RepID=UPI0018942A32|nr:hypothetical protein [Nocardia abscessus]MBF6341579.1 hypothetical protein [Nocardia abscessus]
MTRHRTVLAVLCCVAAAVLAAVALAGPDHGDRPDTTSAPGDAEHSIHGLRPDTAGPAEAAQQALAALFTWQPVTDATTGVALSRARPWLTGELARASQYPLATGVREPPYWAAWRRSGDIVTAHAVAPASPDCHRDGCTVTAVVTQTVLHRDGTSTPYQVMHVNAATQHTPEEWKLSDYRIQQ